MGRKIIPKEVRDFNDLRDQLIDALQKKNTAQDELIAQLTEEIQTLKETLRVVRENQQLEKELDK